MTYFDQVDDPAAGLPRRYYRARLVPCAALTSPRGAAEENFSGSRVLGVIKSK